MMSDLVELALRDWFSTPNVQQPANTSYEVEHNGVRYAVLENCNGVLAVYRYDASKDRLSQIQRWPRAVTSQSEETGRC